MLRNPMGFFDGNGFRPTREDDALGIKLPGLFITDIEGADFTINTNLSHPTGDELGILRSEIEDENFFGVDV